MFDQGERREMRKETSRHAVSRTNQSAMERGERSISIGWCLERPKTNRSLEVLNPRRFLAELLMFSGNWENQDGRTDADAAG